MSSPKSKKSTTDSEGKLGALLAARATVQHAAAKQVTDDLSAKLTGGFEALLPSLVLMVKDYSGEGFDAACRELEKAGNVKL